VTGGNRAKQVSGRIIDLRIISELHGDSAGADW